MMKQPEILFEDERFVAVDKPAGVVVHPAYKNTAGTLLDWLHERDPSVQVRILGRLDKLTSGIVLAAKDVDAYRLMQRRWQTVEKDYLAIVHGRVEPARGEIDLRIAADATERRRRVASTETGAASRTCYERLAYTEEQLDGDVRGVSLVRCRLLTGRRHQIRVHLAARGWPILGDDVYGAPPTSPGHSASPGLRLQAAPPALVSRHALHAWRLAFVHPSTGMRVQVEAPVPQDLRELIEGVLGTKKNAEGEEVFCLLRSSF